MSLVNKHDTPDLHDVRPAKIRKLNPASNDASETPSSHGTSDFSVNNMVNTEGEGVKDVVDTECNHAASPPGDEAEPEMSKSMRKRLAKRQAHAETRDEWKAKKREKEKEKKARKTAERLAAEEADPTLKEKRLAAVKKPGRRPVQIPITLLLDCAFDNLMSEKEINSLSAQLTRCYSDNKNATFRTQLMVSGFGGKLEKRFETGFSNNHLGWRNVVFMHEDIVVAAEKAHAIMYSEKGGQVVGALKSATSNRDDIGNEINARSQPQLIDSSSNGPKPEDKPPIRYIPNYDSDTIIEASSTHPAIVYLSSDSPNTLEVLSPHTTYIIGGIVDKNRHKGLCYKRAREMGIPTAKLPIGEYMDMQSRSVLATNHVVEIMINWLELGDWADAFVKCIPKRKEAKVKGTVDQDAPGEEEEGEEDKAMDIQK